MVEVLFIFTLFWANPVHAAQLRIAVVLSEDSGAYREFATELQNRSSGQHTVIVTDAATTVKDADLVVAVGMKAANAFTSSSVPVLNVFVPRAGFEKLRRRPSANFSAIYLDQPMERQLALLTAALPDATEIGVLYATPPPELSTLKKLLAATHLSLHEQAVDHDHVLAGALSQLLQRSEVLFILPDAAIYNSDTIRNILLETYRKQVPMIGISQNYVRAGALCAVYTTPQQFAQQVMQAIEQFEISGKFPGSQYPSEFEVAVNTQVARSLGLNLKDAEQLRAALRRKQ